MSDLQAHGPLPRFGTAYIDCRCGWDAPRPGVIVWWTAHMRDWLATHDEDVRRAAEAPLQHLAWRLLGPEVGDSWMDRLITAGDDAEIDRVIDLLLEDVRRVERERLYRKHIEAHHGGQSTIASCSSCAIFDPEEARK